MNIKVEDIKIEAIKSNNGMSYIKRYTHKPSGIFVEREHFYSYSSFEVQYDLMFSADFENHPIIFELKNKIFNSNFMDSL